MSHPESLILVGGLAGLWLAAWRASGRPWPRGRALTFLAGLAALLAASHGPLHDLAETPLIAAHMLQHLLLTLVAPPCLLAGAPGWMVDALLDPLLRRPAAARAARAITAPLPAYAIAGVTLLAWHLPAPYAAMGASPLVHGLAHASLVLTAALGWWPVLSPSRRLPALPHGAQILYLFALGMPMTIAGAMITGASQLIYLSASADPLADQRLGGLVMWVPAGLVPVIAFTVVFFRWVAAEVEDFR